MRRRNDRDVIVEHLCGARRWRRRDDANRNVVPNLGGAPDCCPGLTEVHVLSRTTGASGVICSESVAATFICIEGTCGDGVCEAPENQRCTCPQDCGGNNPDGG